jgi:hypothetical protein
MSKHTHIYVQIPRMFVILPEPVSPLSQAAKICKSLSSVKVKPLLHEHYRLVFLCDFDGSPVSCGEDGNGYLVLKDSKLLKQIRPLVKYTLMLLRGITAVSGLVSSDEFSEVSNALLPQVCLCCVYTL